MAATISITIQLLLLLLVNFSQAEEYGTVRRTQYGFVRGQIAESRSNSTFKYFSFNGIQYARPALGKLRFQEAQPPIPWNNVQNTIQPRQICLQFDDAFSSTNVVGSEDCLYLNVYVPITARQDQGNMPVMVWIHGGNWVSASTYETAPDYFMEKPVVIVEIEYRLNVFGFLTTLDNNAKGNLGLKDQVMALQWIQNNIQYFDGDRTRVTIFGVSAGGAAVFYHMLSPLSQGLFSQVISESGSPLNRWAIQRQPLERTISLARHFGINSTNTQVIVEKLQEVNAEALFRAAFNYSIVGYFAPYDPQPFSTVIEKESNTAFICEPAHMLFRRGHFARVPLIMGITTEEGSFSWTTVSDGRVDVNLYQREPQRFIPLSMNLPNNSPCVNKTLNDITQKYFPARDYTNRNQFIPYMSLDLFLVGILETGKFLYDKMPVYFYEFTYTGSRPSSHLGGVGHQEELLYLFYPQGYQANPNETNSDVLTRKRMITLWTNFASTGNPTPRPDLLLQNVRWPTMNATQSHLNIGSHLTVQKPLPYQSDVSFWNEVYRTCAFPDSNPNVRNIPNWGRPYWVWEH